MPATGLKSTEDQRLCFVNLRRSFTSTVPKHLSRRRQMNVTFDKSLASFIMESLKVDTCYSCEEKITPDTYGGSIKLDEGAAHFHNQLPCLLDLATRINSKKKG